MKQFLLLLFIVFCTRPTYSQNDQKVFLITLDGLRWQEVFGGAVDSLILSKTYTHETDQIIRDFLDSDPISARSKLMPFFWLTLAKQGQIYGNRAYENNANCSNPYWFSYPGYNEILTGSQDPEVDSNDKKYNKNTTVLEWLNQKKDLKGKVAAFCSWDVFPYIINDQRSGVPVNAGFQKAKDNNLSAMESALNMLQDEVPSPWGSVRLDAFTHHYMMEYVKKNKPRMVYIAYGETDDFAHDGRYDHYLNATRRTDGFIQKIWEMIQTDPFYKDQTTLIITTDHGRGTSPMDEWRSHGSEVRGGDEIWIAAIGPKVSALGEVKSEMQLYQNQVAATVAKIFGYNFEGSRFPAGPAIHTIQASTN